MVALLAGVGGATLFAAPLTGDAVLAEGTIFSLLSDDAVLAGERFLSGAALLAGSASLGALSPVALSMVAPSLIAFSLDRLSCGAISFGADYLARATAGALAPGRQDCPCAACRISFSAIACNRGDLSIVTWSMVVSLGNIDIR